MKKTKTISVSSPEEIPTLKELKSIPRGHELIIIFKNGFNSKREQIGEQLKKKLPNFQIGINVVDPKIHIAKLISDKEIEENQDFFERCAKDYRRLGKELLFKLVDKLDLQLNEDYPLQTFNQLKRGKRQRGKMENWRYSIHGFHCRFENKITGQVIEVPLVFGLELGDLDPYFFTNFIKSTPGYIPLPIEIYKDYADGKKIIKKMISLGKFERINSNIGNHYGVVVSDRDEVEIKSYKELSQLLINRNKKSKFNFWKFIGLKR